MMWNQGSLIKRLCPPSNLIQRLLFNRRSIFCINGSLLQQQQDNKSINQGATATTALPKISNNPLRDFTLHSNSSGGDINTNAKGQINLAGLKFNLKEDVDSMHMNNDSNIKDKLNKALMLENSEIRETALSTKFGPLAGRTVDVINGDTNTAFRRLDAILTSNGVWKDRRDQRFHMKPGKKKELKRSQHHRKKFMKGFKRLMDVVKDANRKGY